MRQEVDLTDLRKASRALRKAKQEHHEAILAANAAGASLRQIAAAADLSHQRIHQIVNPHTKSAA